MTTRPGPRIPIWFVALAVLVTATITVWAVLRKQGGQQEWPGDPNTLPQRITQVLSPAVAASDTALRPVAGTARQPTVIRAGTPPPHGDRGACTLCHVIVDKMGAVVPAIRAMSSLPHAYRGGICGNCHQVTPTSPSTPSPTGTPAAMAAPVASVPLPAPTPWPQPAMGLLRPAPVREGSWMGLEVVPVTALTAAQYKLPAGQSGVVVAEAEGAAAAAGVRAGDLLVAVNGSSVADMPTFLQATQGQTSGTIDVLRGGRILRGVVGSPPASPAASAAGLPAAPARSGGGPPPIEPY